MILVVEDDPISREAIESVLQQTGARVVCAASAAAGWDYYQRSRPQLIVSDISLGEGDTGLNLLARIRALEAEKHQQPTPAIAITGLEGPAILDEVIRAGFNYFIAKPVDLSTLTALARTSLTHQK